MFVEVYMKKLLNCRRTVMSIFAILCLTLLGLVHGVDIGGIAIAIAGVAGSLSGANAWESRAAGKKTDKVYSPD